MLHVQKVSSNWGYLGGLLMVGLGIWTGNLWQIGVGALFILNSAHHDDLISLNNRITLLIEAQERDKKRIEVLERLVVQHHSHFHQRCLIIEAKAEKLEDAPPAASVVHGWVRAGQLVDEGVDKD